VTDEEKSTLERVPDHERADGSATPAGVVALAHGIRGCRRCAPRPPA